MKLNINKLVKYFIMLLIGFSFVFYGLLGIVIKDHSKEVPTDLEIVQRARELGMVGIDELYLEHIIENE